MPYPQDALSYLANVSNDHARAFYAKHGVKLIDAAYEANEERDDVSLMITKHCLRYSFNLSDAADAIEKAVSLVLDQGLRTGDIWSQGCTKVGTQEMGDAVVAALRNL